MAEKNESNEIRLQRVYDAPVKAVWDAWVDPAQVGHWWGPRGFTLTTHSKDFRVGGVWSYTMHGPDGTDYPNLTTYLEIEPYARMVYDHGAATDRPPLFRVTVTFSEQQGRTRMDMTMALATPEAAANTRKFIRKAGGDSTWDRLAEHLADVGSGKSQFVINRSFAAPIDVLYEMWTNPAHFSRWLPPSGFTMQFIECDIRPGGHSFWKMTGDGKPTMYGRAAYLAMERPYRVVYTQQFSDEKGNLARHPMAPTWPATMLTTVTLTEEGSDQTRVTVMWQVHGPATPIEIETFLNARAGMTQGWTGSFDKLEALLAPGAGV